MRIVSCGSSFASIDPNLVGTHYSELVAEELGGTLLSLAKPGSSNFAVRLQLQSAIEMKPDLIMFEFTNADKLDLPLSVIGQDGEYVPSNNAHNLRYTNYGNVVPFTIDLHKESILSDGIKNFINGECFAVNSKLTPMARQALQYWFTELYDERLKYHQDYFTCASVFSELEHHNIPYIWSRGDLCMFDWSIYKNEVGEGGNPWIGWTDPGMMSVYHTTPDRQKEIAKHWIDTYNRSYNERS